MIQLPTRSVVIVPSWAFGPRRGPGTLLRQQAVLAREPQDTAAAGADAGEAPPRPELAVALAVEGAARQELSDLPGQGGPRPTSRRPAPAADARHHPGGGGARRSPARRPAGA